MALGRKVDQVVRRIAGEEVVHRLGIADVCLDEDDPLVVDERLDGAVVARIG